MKLDFDPEIDPPATIAVIGGGPVGIEAALYGRVLGYSMLVIDSAKVGNGLIGWGDWSMPGSWSQVTSPLGLAALEAQNKELPPLENIPSYHDYLEKYLLPLARTDLIYESIQINATVKSVSRLGCTPGTRISPAERSEMEFRVLIDSQRRGQYSQLADIILDCSGLNQLMGLAPGGGLATGESNLDSIYPHLHCNKSDILDKDREKFLGKHCLLWGNSHEACANAVDLSKLVAASEDTRVTWIIPQSLGKQLSRFELPAGNPQLHEQLVALERQPPDRFGILEAWGIEAIRTPATATPPPIDRPLIDQPPMELESSAHDSRSQDAQEQQVASEAGRIFLRLQTSAEETLDVQGDVFVNCARRLPDWNFAGSLSVVEQTRHSVDDYNARLSSLTSEPHYYVLGKKSESFHPSADGQTPQANEHPYATAFKQIRETFALIGGRAELDLYESLKPQGSS